MRWINMKKLLASLIVSATVAATLPLTSAFASHFDNMLVVNTGVLPRAGGINSTCAVLPLVEE